MPLSRKVRRILKRVAANDPSLREVNLNGEGIGDDGAKKVAEAFQGNTTVTKLFLYNNGIGAEGAKELADMLCHNSAITFLHLVSNDIGAEGANDLADMLRHNSTITILLLNNNGIGAEGAKELAKALLHNSAVTDLYLSDNDVGAEGAKDLAKALLRNSSVTTLDLYGNDISAELEEEVEDLVRINERASNPQEALGLKVERLVASNDGGGAEAAVSLTLERLDTFPSAEQRRELFGRLLGSERGRDVAATVTLKRLDMFPSAGERRELFGHLLGFERGRDVAAAVDIATGRTLYWLAAECGAAPGALMNVLRAHPSLITCRDAKNHLYPFALLATMPTAGVGDVFELLLLNPALVEGGIS